MAEAPTSVAGYRRSVYASGERVWENVHDWEHLPWLHRESFASIALEESGGWGWRARIGLHPVASGREIRLELVRDGDDRYVSRVLEGPGAGTEIWTTVTPVSDGRTDIEVEFVVPGVASDRRQQVGRGYVALYTLLWDQDEAMMQHRTRMLARPHATRAVPDALDLGPLVDLRERLPLVVDYAGRGVRIVDVDGELVAHSTLCPHWLGPLDDASVDDGTLVCPWHGYRFDLRSGQGCGPAERLSLAPAPRVDVDGDRVRLVAPTS